MIGGWGTWCLPTALVLIFASVTKVRGHVTNAKNNQMFLAWHRQITLLFIVSRPVENL
jgi:hypothetical protein